SYARNYGLNATALRIGWVYGPGRETDAIVQPVMRSSAAAPYVLDQGGDHRLQFIHVDDVVAAVLAAWDAAAFSSAAYNINGTEIFSVRQICQMIGTLHPAARTDVGPGLLPGSDLQGRIDIKLAARGLDWSPQVPFAQ